MTDRRSEIEELERRVRQAVQDRDIPWLDDPIAAHDYATVMDQDPRDGSSFGYRAGLGCSDQ